MSIPSRTPWAVVPAVVTTVSLAIMPQAGNVAMMPDPRPAPVHAPALANGPKRGGRR